MTHGELILESLRVGLDGEKVDYGWEKVRTNRFW